MKTAFIMRGVPGSGKSTMARVLAGQDGIICSADDYFVGPDGIYEWFREGVHAAHAECYEKFLRAVESGQNVVVDNTFVYRKHMVPYVKALEEHGYIWAEVKMPMIDVETSFVRNLHKVPRHTIEKMIKEFEP